ncbi:MAG: hypothetical protein AAFP84_08695 [Actinomycetota bacterium]
MSVTSEYDDDLRVMLRNPNTGRDDLRIRRSIYEPVRAAILAAIDGSGELANSELRSEVERRTPARLWEQHSVGWYTTSVKLDLEARGLLAKDGSPQRLFLTDAGRAELVGAV